jgi:hypothetical protein
VTSPQHLQMLPQVQTIAEMLPRELLVNGAIASTSFALEYARHPAIPRPLPGTLPAIGSHVIGYEEITKTTCNH